MNYDLFSQRQAQLRGEYPPKPTRTTFPELLRENIATIFTETLGMYYDGELGIGVDPVKTTNLWIEFERYMKRGSAEYTAYVRMYPGVKPNRRICAFVLSATDDALVNLLDLGIALIVQLAGPMQRQYDFDWAGWHVKLAADDAIAELDVRLRTEGMIYRIVDNALVISTDDVTHELAVVPALQCLSEDGFEGASAELHEALAAHRNGQFDQTLIKANHAFESTMKIIAKKMGWSYEETTTAKKLLDVMFGNGLMPTMRESAMKALATMLESDVPTMRNKTPSAGHGRGDRTEAIPEAIATYAITATAANIKLLVESYRLKRS